MFQYQFDWSVVLTGQYAQWIVDGIKVTIQLSVASIALSFLMGLHHRRHADEPGRAHPRGCPRLSGVHPEHAAARPVLLLVLRLLPDPAPGRERLAQRAGFRVRRGRHRADDLHLGLHRRGHPLGHPLHPEGADGGGPQLRVFLYPLHAATSSCPRPCGSPSRRSSASF